MAFLLEYVSDFTADVFFRQKRSLLVKISTKKATTKDKIINIPSLKKDFEILRDTF